MQKTSYGEGVPSWVDLSTHDLDGSRRFYSQVFGWDIEPGPPETGGYSNATLRGLPVAGIGPQMDPNLPPYWTNYVNVADVDAVAGRVSEAGGRVAFGPTDVMEFGRLALFLDPTGAALGLWQPNTHRGAGLVDEPGAFAWSELITSDSEGAKTFYEAVFGWHPVSHGEGPHEYTEFEVDGESIAGMLPKQPDMPEDVPSFWGVYFAVADIAASLEQAKSLGATVVMGPNEVPQGTFAALTDNVGAIFSMIQLAAEP
ncbi:MAG: VOC family protein [Acidimicrobiaceae bacterium]|nr:VOC family protein [Acidimicrobiaceae bacterium]